MNMLQSRVKYFFSSLNMINMFKRAVKSAITTIKELDASMTETAVVTNFSVGDMWNKLPEYSSKAQ
jgi:prefoldin subunit 5